MLNSLESIVVCDCSSCVVGYIVIVRGTVKIVGWGVKQQSNRCIHHKPNAFFLRLCVYRIHDVRQEFVIIVNDIPAISRGSSGLWRESPVLKRSDNGWEVGIWGTT